MRSRYTAFARRDADYLLWSWHSTFRPAVVTLEATRTWTGLTIVRTVAGQPSDDEGVVEFNASYRDVGGSGVVHEVSRFVREDGRWVYLGGVHS